MEAPRLRPLDIGELLDVAFKIYGRHFGLLVKTVALVVIPVQLVGGLILLGTIDDPSTIQGDFQLEQRKVNEDDATGALAALFVTTVIGGIAVLVATAACVKAVADAYLQERPEAGSSLRFAGGRTLALLWVSILQFIVLIPAFLALIVPGIWLAISFAVAFPVLMIESERGGAALRRSFRLVRGRWWPTFGVILIAYLLAAVVQFAIGAIVGVLNFTALEDSLFGTVAATTTGNILAYVLATPFQAAIVVLVYFDLRVRKEGLDIELLAQRIGVQAPQQGPLGHNRPPLQPFVPPSPPGAPGPPGEGPAEPHGATEPQPPDGREGQQRSE